MNKAQLKLFVTSLLVGLAFFLGIVSVQAGNPNNIVPMSDETQACREACGLGEGKPSGDFFGYDSANACLNNCFAAKGIGNVEGSCDPNLADNCCNAFAAPGQDPDCNPFELNSCLSSLSHRTNCRDIGGTPVTDESCPSFTELEFLHCIDEGFTSTDCAYNYGGVVQADTSCPSNKGCFLDITASERCLENKCPRQNDDVEYLTVNSTTGDATFKNLRDNRNYSCTLLGSQPGFDCKTVTAGTVVDLISLGILGDDLACHTHFNIGTDNVPNLSLQECTYSCSIQP